MNRSCAIILICFVALSFRAQKYCNEWINYGSRYFKFPVSSEGVYRIDSTTLSAYYDLNNINPKNLKLIFRGKEQFLYIKGENDNKINTGDYIDCYLDPLARELDSLLYTNIAYLPNPYASIFNDTVYAFVTLVNTTNNKRYLEENDTAFANYNAPAFFYAEKINVYSSAYNYVSEFTEGVSDPHYTQAEGRGANFTMGNSINTSFSALNPYTQNNLSAYFSTNFSGASLNYQVSQDHEIKIDYNGQNGTTVLYDSLFRGFVPVRKNFIINASDLTNTSNFNFTSVAASQFNSVPGFSNRTLLHYTKLYYPHSLTFSNESFSKMFVDDNANTGKSTFVLNGFNPGPSNRVLVYDITNGKRILSSSAAGQLRVVIPNSQNKKTCILLAESQVKNVSMLVDAGLNGTFTNYKNNTGTQPYLIIYHKSLESSANAYKNYRQSPAGGNFNVVMANVSELYEQYGYGINKHPQAIKNYLKFLNDSLPVPPAYALLIGKGVEQDLLEAPTQYLNLVPTMGYPASDVLLAASLNQPLNNTYFPDIPIGRIAATTNSQVTNYLAKVQQHESTGPEDWKKRVLHFVGGDSPGLTQTLNAYMEGYEQTIEDTLFGAEVLTYKKNTSSPIQVNISDSIKNVINGGAALLNFFGHGSNEGFDQAIDDPETYNNVGKYPFIIANSCYSGNIHLKDNLSVSEKFIFTSQKGSIGFLATTAYGFPYALNNYTRGFYQAISVSRYNRGIGDVIKETAFQNSVLTDNITRFTGLDMTLHGDPAVKISNGELPDYQLKNNDVSFDLRTYGDSLGVRINMKNAGKAVSDSFYVRVERFFPNGDSAVVMKKISSPRFKDSLVFFMALDFDRGIGLNKFNVMLDRQNEIQESSETNNNTIGSVDFFVPGGDITPVYPYKYAIVPKTNTITLKASTSDPFAPAVSYRFQLDTCDRFVSPLQTKLITSIGGVITWDVQLPFSDSTVYFWRVSRDSISPAKAYNWRESSFQTIGNKTGWSQAHFHQYKNDAYQFVNYRKDLRKFVFENNLHTVKGRTGIYPNLSLDQFNYYFNEDKKEGWPSALDGWNIAVFDSISGHPQETRSANHPATGPGIYNNCVEHQPRLVYSFGAWSACGSPSSWQTDLQNFINAIPPNQYVLAYTTGWRAPTYSGLSSYNNSLFSAFESIGARDIRTTPDSVAYILFGRKGMTAGQANVKIGRNKTEVLVLEDSIKTRWQSGYVASEIIGPSYKWNSLHWRTKGLENNNGDTTLLKVIGIKVNGEQDTLKTFTKDSADVFALYNYVDANVYPHLKLVALMKDNVNRTSPQLKRWQVLYDQAPECAINPLKGFASINDTLQEGDQVTFRFPVENIGTETFKDSLVFTYWIEDNNRNKTLLPDKMKARLFAPGQVIIDTVKINSFQLLGNNALWIYVNPIQNLRYQKEQSSFNNIGRYAFKVDKDLANPLLDVTFDGVRILNGDIVSAKPAILITLKDENKFLALNDTSAFTVQLQAPGQSQQQRIYFGQGLQFTPANLPKNSCSILYTPTLPIDGKYNLSVQARDRSRNASGAQDYQIQFEINNKPTVTGVLNYPNPFSTSTKFVFTLTGSEIPEVFTIRIMTITGKIVREITRSELGYLHIGRNITEYAWDGRDNFGDRLGNGVYLYHVITKLNGQNIDKSTTGADKFFVKEFGKMVLMR